MSLESTLTRGREAAESRMTSRCKIAHQSGSAVSGGLKVPAWTVDHADQPVRIGGANAGSAPSRRIDVAGVSAEVPARVAFLPVETTVSDSSVIEVTSGDCAGLFFRVIESDPQDQATARRVQVIGTERPGGWS